MAAHALMRERRTSMSLFDVLEAAMPEMPLSEEDNFFLEAVRRGNLRQVKEYFRGRPNVLETEAEIIKDSKLGSFGLILAAQQDNYDLVKFLLSQGYRIEEPHSRSCACDSCNAMGSLEKALYRLNGYRALASPVYLSLSYLADCEKEELTNKNSRTNDPVHQAFVLNGRMERLAREEYEFKKDYCNLSTRCEEYAVALLNLCRNMKEIGCVMTMPSIRGLAHVQVRTANKAALKLTVLNFAIKNKNERFVAHPYSQLMLNAVLYQDFDERWIYRRTITKVAFVLLYMIFLPLWSVVYLLTPHNKLSQKLATPLAKFLSHTCSFCWFLVILVLSSVQDTLGISLLQVSWIDILTGLWVLGLTFEEAKEFYRQGRERYFAQWWNFVTILMLLFFYLAGIFWLLGSSALSVDDDTYSLKYVVRNITRDSAFRFLLLSNSFFSVAFLVSFFHLSNSFQVNSDIGPLQLSLMKMCQDVGKFLLLFLLVFLSFSMAVRKVYSQFEQITDLYPAKTKEVRAAHEFSGFSAGLRKLFWALFDKTDLEAFEIKSSTFYVTQTTGETLFAFFNIVAILISLNMLIAMMSNSFQQIADDADIQWKFSRTGMWMQYVDKGSVVPPPFNLLPSGKYFIEFCKRCYDRIKFQKRERYDDLESSEEVIEEDEDMLEVMK